MKRLVSRLGVLVSLLLFFWKALLWESWLLSYFPVLHLSLSEAFLFSQLGRFFSPTGQVILRAFWITMQRYEIPICQVCDSMRYHAIAEHFYSKHLTFNIEKVSGPSDSIAGPSPAKLTLITNNSPLSRFPEVFYDSLNLFGSKRLASLVIFHLLQLIPERTAAANPTHEMIHGRAWHTDRKSVV